MKSLRVSLEHTDETIQERHAFVCESPDVEREVLLDGKATDDVETSLSYVEGDPDSYEAELASSSRVREYDLTPLADGGFFVYVRQEMAERDLGLLDALGRGTVVPVPPMEFRSDRTVRLTLIGPPEDLQDTLDALPDGMGVDVHRISGYTEAIGGSLTGRQREALAAAWDAGYYDVPREGDLDAVASALDCAPSTASTLLRRAESHLVARALGRST